MSNRNKGARRSLKRVFLYGISSFTAALVLFGAWYLWGEQKSRSGITMNHQFKRDSVGAGCDLCHQISDADPRFVTFPTHETCSACHGDAVDETSAEKDCELCHNLPGYETHVRKNEVLIPHVKFNHRVHAEREINCEACHAVVDSSVLVGDEMLPAMETCVGCHKERSEIEAKNCASCHVKGFEKRRPSDHSKEWIKSHGVDLTKERIDENCRVCHKAELNNSCTTCHHRKEYVIGKTDSCARCHGKGFEKKRPKDHTPIWVTNHGKRLTQEKIDANCTLCHTAQNRNDCESCHRREAPKNHNTAWRVRSHGNVARLDREKCSTCHDQSECIACHTTNEPFSHTGLWGSPYNRHCINCHMEGLVNKYVSGAVGGNCSFCHQSAEVYAEHKSLPLPSGHSIANCTNCHRISGGFGTNIRHPYPTDSAQCVTCHQ
jgi:hypothetical protein